MSFFSDLFRRPCICGASSARGQRSAPCLGISSVAMRLPMGHDRVNVTPPDTAARRDQCPFREEEFAVNYTYVGYLR